MIRKLILTGFIFIFLTGMVWTEEKVDYYTCGMHPSVRSNEPGLCPICNMNLIPVYSASIDEEKDISKSEEDSETVFYGCVADEQGQCPSCDLSEPGAICKDHVFTINQIGKIMKCPICGGKLKELSKKEVSMQYDVVSRVRIPEKQVELAGVKTEVAKKHHLSKEIRTVGTVAYDPDLVVAQEEYVSALDALDKSKGTELEEITQRHKRSIESSKRKLLLLGMDEEEINDLGRNRKVDNGLILPNERMWVYGDIYEYELSWIKPDQEVMITSISFPGEKFKGTVKSINPVLDPKTRSVKVRIAVFNQELKLRPEMYVDIVIKSDYIAPNGEHMVLAIPVNAVLDTGLDKIVWVDKGNTEYEGRKVISGPEAIMEINDQKKHYLPILKGISVGDKVVVKANFLIDSQSQISGIVASAYGGSLGEDNKETPQEHNH